MQRTSPLNLPLTTASPGLNHHDLAGRFHHHDFGAAGRANYHHSYRASSTDDYRSRAAGAVLKGYCRSEQKQNADYPE
jgi:hypothetical protein